MMFSKTSSAILATLFIGMTLSLGAYACSTEGWDVVSESGIDVGSPFGAVDPDVDGVPRVEELCAMRASAQGYVQTNAPSHDRVRGRFYIFADLTASVDGVGSTPTVMRAYSDEGGASALFEIWWNAGSYTIDATANGGGLVSVAGDGGWDMIEFDWDPSGSGNLTYWVNSDATEGPGGGSTGSIDAGAAATMESMQLGLPDGPGTTSGNAYFDSVELHNQTFIGPLPNIGDANGDGAVSALDYFTIRDELLTTALGQGKPDCNLDGAVSALDYFCIRDILLQ